MALPAEVSARQRPKHLKRDSSHLTGSTAALSVSNLPSRPSLHPLSPSSKRIRVAFKEDIDVRILGEQALAGSARAQDLVMEEVRIALETHRRKTTETSHVIDDSPYDALRAVFLAAGLKDDLSPAHGLRSFDDNADIPDGRLLRQYLLALTRRTGELKECNTLVYAILDMNWFGRDEALVSVYVKFLGALVSVIPGYLRPAIEKIVRHFVSLPSAYGRISGQPIVRKRQMFATLHSSLHYLTSLIPSAGVAIRDALQSQFPNHRMTSRKDYLAYMRHLFKIITYLPEIRNDVLTLMTERLVKIDVDIQEGLEDLDDDDLEDARIHDDETKDNYFLDDDTSDESDADSDASSDMEDDPEERKLKDLREKSSKLDAGLDFLFSHYSSDGGIVADHQTGELDSLLSLFSTFVLPTYRSRHVQFLIFHFAQVDADKTAYFVSRCLNLLQGTAGTTVSSVNLGSAYLASFLARGARVSRSLLHDVVAVLIARINALRERYERSDPGPDIGRFMPFYTAMQALLYIFCFRWRELLFDSTLDSDEDDYNYEATLGSPPLPGLRECLHQSIYSRLNPLKVCAPLIVAQFAAIANHIKYLYVFSLLETNKRVRLSSYRTYGGSTQSGGAMARRDNALSAKGGEAHHQLDAYFPFDPYRLPRSKRWLEGDYNEWKGIAGMKYSGDAESDEEIDEDDDDEDAGGVEYDEASDSGSG